MKMTNIRKLLFPVDLSETSSEIISYVCEMAKKFNSEIHILSVIETNNQSAFLPFPECVFPNDTEESLDLRKKRLHLLRYKYFQDFPVVKTTVMPGEIVNSILNYVESEKIDLVIMETHGRSGLAKLFHGSVTDRIVRNSSAPVFVINQTKLLDMTFPSNSLAG